MFLDKYVNDVYYEMILDEYDEEYDEMVDEHLEDPSDFSILTKEAEEKLRAEEAEAKKEEIEFIGDEEEIDLLEDEIEEGEDDEGDAQ